MANSLEPEVLMEDSSGNLSLPETELESFRLDAINILRTGTITPGYIPTTILNQVDVGAAVLPFGPQPSSASQLDRMMDADPQALSAFDNGLSNALNSAAQFLNVSIDSPIAKTMVPPFIDPTIVVSKVRTAVKEVVTQVSDAVESLLEPVLDARDEDGNRLVGDETYQELVDSVSFEVRDLTLEEVLLALPEATLRLATLLVAPIAENINALLEVFGIPGLGDIIDGIRQIVQTIQDIIIPLLMSWDGELRQLLREKLEELITRITDTIKTELQDAVIAAIEAILGIPIPELPQLPSFIIGLPDFSINFFPNLELPISLGDFLNFPQNILTEILALFDAIKEFFTVTLWTPEFLANLLAALARGLIGLLEFVVDIVITIIKAAFSITANALFKAACLVALVVRLVKYMCISIVGYVIGDGMIFSSIKASILAG